MLGHSTVKLTENYGRLRPEAVAAEVRKVGRDGTLGPPRMAENQSGYDIRCEWGAQGIASLRPGVAVVVIVDVLCFSTCVEIATTRGATVFPHPRNDATARRLALEVGAELAGPRGEGGFSLSPVSFLGVPRGARVVLPSPNGASLSLGNARTPTLAGCLRNAKATARVASRAGRRVAVIPAGEKWPDGSLRPCLEDWLGAGAIIEHLAGSRSPEAQAAVDQYRASAGDLEGRIRACSSGWELADRGFGEDVVLACDLNVSEGVPILTDNAYVVNL